MEAALPRFRAADTQVLGVSVDSIYCHANWARELGGVSFPLLADFEPKGGLARAFGRYLADAGITDRATVVIDKAGVVRASESVTPAGRRDVDQLVALCASVEAAQDAPGALPEPPGLPGDVVLYVKSHCGASRKTLLALDNLHVRDRVTIRNVSDDAGAAAELERTGGRNQAPCLACSTETLFESDAIVRWLVDRVAPV